MVASPLSRKGCCHCLPARPPARPLARSLARSSGVLLQDLLLQTCKSPLSNKLLMSLSLSPGSFFGLEAGQLQGLLACEVQPNNWHTSREAEETPVSAEILGNKDGKWKEVGVTRGGRPLASGALWQLTTIRGVFLFHYIDDTLLTSESLSSLKVAALCSWLI